MKLLKSKATVLVPFIISAMQLAAILNVLN